MQTDGPRTRVYPVHARTSFLVYGLILSIAIFFVATFIAYLARFVLNSDIGPRPALPVILWVSTAVLLLGSHFLWRAYRNIRLERQKPFRRNITIAFIFGGIFCVLQSVGITELAEGHWRQAVHVSGALAAIAFLIFLHVAHFVAGYIGLAYVTVQAHRGRYDHEFHNGVRLAAIYWRFLDVVWLIMLLMFWFTG
ncbi:MAG: heme-copper oxidase subunit III [Rubinisphaera brasiliensis]|uniref:cytochrome c oxidase subunit 3 n=1 Tax=Rubinisphaera TaxID=1649490 RepID=UPI001F311249|nr:hypothetical protein [Rubinisphaera sp. JC750]MBR9800314.1 hypothetical protein [bacterium]